MTTTQPLEPTAAEQKGQSGADGGVQRALLDLCMAVLPVWGRQLASSRVQAESAVSEMLAAFAEIGPHLDLASRQSKQISVALLQGQTSGIEQLSQACAAELHPLQAQLDTRGAAAIDRVTALIETTVKALEQVAKPFEHETEMVSLQVERMYQGFQYQDRINQMMALLQEDMERLLQVMGAPVVDIRALSQTAWMERLESQYAMAEQRQVHAGAQTTPGDNLETTFF